MSMARYVSLAMMKSSGAEMEVTIESHAESSASSVSSRNELSHSPSEASSSSIPDASVSGTLASEGLSDIVASVATTLQVSESAIQCQQLAEEDDDGEWSRKPH